VKLSAITFSLFLSGVFADQETSDLYFGMHGVYNSGGFYRIKHHQNDIFGSGIMSDFHFHLGKFQIVNKMFMSDSWEAVSKGGGKRVKGIYGYTHEGYISYSKISGGLSHQWLYGRTFLDHGFGKMSGLLISRDSRPFDAFNWQVSYKSITGTLNAIQLEQLNGKNRYLTVHSVKLNIKNGLSLLFSESSLYASSGDGFNWQLLNPVVFWVPERENFPIIPANGLLYAGIHYQHSAQFSCFTEVLIDDWQINNKYVGDLEPNEVGFTAGLELSGVFIPRSKLWLEYTMITNRTYQTSDIAESYTHRGFPIGHYLGNDFDLLQFQYSINLDSRRLKPYISVALHRDGANGLDTPFDSPWMNNPAINLETGYSEQFPTNPFRSIMEMELAADYELKNGSLVNAGLLYSNDSSSTTSSSGFSFVLRLWLTLGKSVQY